MPRWLTRLFQKQPTPAPAVRVIERESSEFTVDQWRTLPELVKAAREVLNRPETKQMVDALKNQHLTVFTTDGYPDLNVRAVVQAQSEGYLMAINDLLALGVYKQPAKDLQETFEPPELEVQPTEKES